MIQKKTILLGCIVCLIFFGLMAGCIGEKNQKYEEAMPLMESANQRVNSIDFQNDHPKVIRSELSVALADLNETMKILNEAESLPDEDQAELDAVKSMISVEIIFIELLKTDYVDYMIHGQNAEDYMDNKNWASVKKEVELGKRKS